MANPVSRPATEALPLGDHAVAVYRWPALLALLIAIPIILFFRFVKRT